MTDTRTVEMEVKVALAKSAGAPREELCRFGKFFDTSSTSSGRKKSRRTNWCKPESGNSSKCLPHRLARRTKAGWSPERRARQAELIRRSAPWRHSTGPKTEAGKARCAKNALRHGGRSQARIRELQRVRYVLRLAADNVRNVNLLIRLHQAAARPQIKYKPRYVEVSNPKTAGRICPPKLEERRRMSWRELASRAMLPQNINPEGNHACTGCSDASS
jgi:hypothetical protein